MAQAMRYADETVWGRASEMGTDRIEGIIFEMSDPGISDFNFRGRMRDFVIVMDELIRRCTAEGAAQDEYLTGHAANMSSAIEELFNNHPVDDFNTPAEMERINDARNALLALFQVVPVTIGGAPGAAAPELRLPEVPVPVPTQVTASLEEFDIEFNENWQRFYALGEDSLNEAERLAGRAAFYETVGNRSAAAEDGNAFLQNLVDNLNANSEASGLAADLTLDKLLSGDWGDSGGVIIDRLGMTAADKDAILNTFRMISEGRMLEALRNAPEGTTLAYTLADIVAGSLRNLELRVPLATIQVDSSVNLYNSDVMFINALAFAELVLSQKYAVDATRIETGANAGRWSLDFVPQGDMEALFGGGAGVEAGLYISNEARYVSLSVMGEWDANLQEAVGTATLKYMDATGHLFGIPCDGRLYGAMLASIDTEGRLHASGTIQLALVQNDDLAIMVSFGGAYGTDISEASKQWLARVGTREYWTLSPGALFEIRNLGEVGGGLERIGLGLQGLFDTEGAQAGIMGSVNFYGNGWSIGAEAGWRRLIVLPDLGNLIIGEDKTIDTLQSGISGQF
ncbi:MAG: hypothetical protein AB1657_01500 [Candidatus Micrarchaeota archaeon]